MCGVVQERVLVIMETACIQTQWDSDQNVGHVADSKVFHIYPIAFSWFVFPLFEIIYGFIRNRYDFGQHRNSEAIGSHDGRKMSTAFLPPEKVLLTLHYFILLSLKLCHVQRRTGHIGGPFRKIALKDPKSRLRMFDQTVESKTKGLKDNKFIQNNDLYRS